jgi:hypothetical protein
MLLHDVYYFYGNSDVDGGKLRAVGGLIMEEIKNAVFTACLCAILMSAVQLLSAERMKKELRLVCGLTLIVCIAAQISGENMKLSLSSPSLSESSDYRRLSSEYEQTVIAETRSNLEKQVMQKLRDIGIAAEKVSIDCSLNEYNSVEVGGACIYLPDGAQASDAESAEKAAEELFEDGEIEVTVLVGGEKID